MYIYIAHFLNLKPICVLECVESPIEDLKRKGVSNYKDSSKKIKLFENVVDEIEVDSKIIEDIKTEFFDIRQMKELDDEQHMLQNACTKIESVIIKQENFDDNFSSEDIDTNIDEMPISFDVNEEENEKLGVLSIEAIEMKNLEVSEFEPRKQFSTTCGFCPEQFSSIEKMLKHIREHHTKKHPFPCIDCYCSFDTDAKLKIHRTFTRTNCKSNCTCMRRIYQNLTPYKPLTKKDPVFKVSTSRIVPKKIKPHNPKISRHVDAPISVHIPNEEKNVETSSMVEASSIIKKNEFMFCSTSADDLQIGVKENELTKNKTFLVTCNFCGDQFSSMEKLFGHIKENHTKQYRYSCSSCFCSFISSDKLNSHHCQTQNNCKSTCTCIRRICMAINKIKPLSKKDPMFSVLEESNVKNIKYNSSENHTSINISSQCNICTNLFESLEDLTKHIENVHVKKETLLLNKFVYNPLNICEHSNRLSANEIKTKESLTCSVALQQLPQLFTKKSFVYVCSDCDEMFLLQVALTDHLGNVHKKFKCNYCFEIYTDSEQVANCLLQHENYSSHVDHNYSRVP